MQIRRRQGEQYTRNIFWQPEENAKANNNLIRDEMSEDGRRRVLFWNKICYEPHRLLLNSEIRVHINWTFSLPLQTPFCCLHMLVYGVIFVWILNDIVYSVVEQSLNISPCSRHDRASTKKSSRCCLCLQQSNMRSREQAEKVIIFTLRVFHMHE